MNGLRRLFEVIGDILRNTSRAFGFVILICLLIGLIGGIMAACEVVQLTNNVWLGVLTCLLLVLIVPIILLRIIIGILFIR